LTSDVKSSYSQFRFKIIEIFVDKIRFRQLLDQIL